MEAKKAYFIVRAEVPNESDRANFDQWYGTHHLPLAMDKFRAEKGWRFWSRSDPSVHYALYQFSDTATLQNCLESPVLKLLNCFRNTESERLNMLSSRKTRIFLSRRRLRTRVMWTLLRVSRRPAGLPREA